MEQEMEEQLWSYIDGETGPEERQRLSDRIATSPAWQIKYAELLAVHQLFQQEQLEMPSMRFTKNVMEEISQYQIAPATKSYINKHVIWGIGAFFLTMITGLCIYFLTQFHWTGGSTDRLLPDLPDAGKLNWSRLLNNTYVNIFIGINALLGLVLLDKYLQDKKGNGAGGHLAKRDSA